jgi:hypothetical protein
MQITTVHTITPQSGIDHDLLSVVKILLKAFCSISVSNVTKAEYGRRDDVTFYTVDPAIRHIHVKKVKFTLVQALRLCTGRTAHRGSRGIALLYRH